MNFQNQNAKHGTGQCGQIIIIGPTSTRGWPVTKAFFSSDVVLGACGVGHKTALSEQRTGNFWKLSFDVYLELSSVAYVMLCNTSNIFQLHHHGRRGRPAVNLIFTVIFSFNTTWFSHLRGFVSSSVP
jgi:hypothetical protein